MWSIRPPPSSREVVKGEVCTLDAVRGAERSAGADTSLRSSASRLHPRFDSPF